MFKKKLLPILLTVIMALTLVPGTVFATGGAENDNLVIGGKEYEPVSSDRLSTFTVNGVEAKVEKGSVNYTVSDPADKTGWDQNSGQGSVDNYTYVGLYVEIPAGATSLKMNDEGNPEAIEEVDSAFLQGGRFQQWFPVAQKIGNDYSLFYGGREYTVLLEWYNGDQLIKKEYVKASRTLADPVAKINNFTYATLPDAVAAAGTNDVIELSDDVTLTETVNITKSVTIDGKNHVIYGDNNKAYTAFNITAGNFTIKNVSVKEFGGNVYTRQGVAVFNVPSNADANVVFNANNVKVSDYNRSAFTIASGTFKIDYCETNALNSYVTAGKDSLTKGITTGYGPNTVKGVISNSVLSGAAEHPDWSASAVEVFYNADVELKNSEIKTFTTGVWVDNFYSLENTTSSLKVENTTITVPEGNDAIVVYGQYEDDNGQVTGGKGRSNVNIVSGTFNGNIAMYGKTANDNITISGGTFNGEVSKDVKLAADIVIDENGNARVDNSDLQALVDKYEALNLKKADYTASSWTAYTEALNDARFVLANVKATKEDIVNVTAALEDAYKALVKAEDIPQTGDSSNMLLWISLLFASGAGVLSTVVYGKKKANRA